MILTTCPDTAASHGYNPFLCSLDPSLWRFFFDGLFSWQVWRRQSDSVSALPLASISLQIKMNCWRSIGVMTAALTCDTEIPMLQVIAITIFTIGWWTANVEANFLPFGAKLIHGTAHQLALQHNKFPQTPTLAASHLHLQPTDLGFSWGGISYERVYE